MRAEICQRLCHAMKEQGFEAIITVSPENFGYVNGFVVPSQPLMRWRHAITVLRRDGKKAVVVIDMEETTVKNHDSSTEVRVWGEFDDDPMVVLGHLLEDLGLANANIGIEFDYLAVKDYATLANALPKARFTGAQDLLTRARQIKTTEEIDLLRKLSYISDKAIHDAFMQASEGCSEMDIAAALTRGVYGMGAQDFKLMIVATGERSVFPNVGPSERLLKHQDVCRVEIFSVIDGYQAGVCRTAVVNEPPPEAERIWKHLVECKYLVMDMIKPGVSSQSVYQTFTDHMSKLDLAPIKFIGHSIGLHLHEEPYLSRFSDVPLEAGMVLGIEPLVYNTGFGFGMQNKDMFLVTEQGCELLSGYSNTDQLIVVSDKN